jgi:hypothetical protein
MYPERRVFFGSGVPVAIFGTDSCEACEILGLHGLGCVRSRSSHLLKEVPQPLGGDDQIDHRFTGDVTPGMLCAPWYVDEVACFGCDPFVALCVVPQTLHRARDDEKLLCIRMTVKRNRDAGRDRSIQHTEVIALIFRRGQKLYRWSEEFDDQAGGGILFKTHMFLFLFSLAGVLP